MGRIDAIEHFFYFFLYGLAEGGRSELHAGLDQFGILRDREIRIAIQVVDDPALTLGHDLVAKFFGGELVSPFAEGALGEFLNVALVHQGYTLAAGLNRIQNRHADQALGSGHGHGLNADAGVEANLLLAVLQHVFVEEFDQAGALSSSLFPLDAGIDVFGVLAVDDHVHALGMLHRRRDALVILHRAHAAIEIEKLAQGHIQGTDAAAYGSGQRAFDGDAKFADGFDGVVGQPGIELGFGFFSGEDFEPRDPALALISFLDGGIEYAQRGLPDVASGAIPLDKRHDWIVGHIVFSIRVANLFSAGRHSHTVIRARHEQPPEKSSK